MHNLPENLKRLRKIKKLTQQDVADYLNVVRQTYNHFETGRNEPDLNTLIKLANIFEVSLDFLSGRYVDPNQGAAEAPKKKKKHNVSS
jgi:transcriptional regulator with XRE-family HTH domain